MADRRRRRSLPPLEAALTQDVYALRNRTRCRRFVPSAYVRLIDPGGDPLAPGSADLLAWDDPDVAGGPAPAGADPFLDHAFRVDLLTHALYQQLAEVFPHPPPTSPCPLHAIGVIVRPGPPEPLDEDLAWWRALRVAAGVTELIPTAVYAVTRAGWVDIINGPATPVLVTRRHRRRHSPSEG